MNVDAGVWQCFFGGIKVKSDSSLVPTRHAGVPQVVIVYVIYQY